MSLEELVEDHWEYVKGVISHAYPIKDYLVSIEFHYKSAFIHGYKHGVEASKEKALGKDT